VNWNSILFRIDITAGKADSRNDKDFNRFQGDLPAMAGASYDSFIQCTVFRCKSAISLRSNLAEPAMKAERKARPNSGRSYFKALMMQFISRSD